MPSWLSAGFQKWPVYGTTRVNAHPELYGYPTVFCVTIRDRDMCVDLRYLTDW